MKLYLLLISTILLCACSHKDGRYPNVRIERFDITATDSAPAQSLAQLAPALDALKILYADSTLTNEEILDRYKNSQATKVFGPDVRSILNDLDGQEAILGIAFQNMSEAFPDLSVPSHVYGYVTPYMQSVVLVDSIMFIGLNHYLGENYQGYEGFEHYKRKLKVPDRIALDATEALLYSGHPYLDSENSVVLNRMLYEGAMINALADILPSVPVSEILGYSDLEWKWAEEHEGDIWKSLAEKGMLYSHDPIIATKIIAPAPNSAVVLPDAPERIGRYIGYKIVKSYIKKHKDLKARDLLSPEFYNSQNSLINAEYMPK